MSDYFSKKKTGGQINSLISNQDSLASVYAVTQLHKRDMFGFGIDIDDFSIQCETDDDICIVSKQNKIFIQVKTGEIRNQEFFEILDNFRKNNDFDDRDCFLVISSFREVTVNKKDISTKILNYRKILMDPNETDQKKESIKRELIKGFSLDNYSEIIDKITIDNRPLYRDGIDTFAIFSSYLRLAYGFKNQKEYYIKEIYNKLLSKIEEARRNRGSISRDVIESIIGEFLVKDTVFDKLELVIGYEKNTIGYVPKVTDNRLVNIQKGVYKSSKKLSRDWRKSYYKEALKNCIFGAKECKNCGHPLVANFCGLGGIACPDCGYSPFVTIFCGCECGEYDVIKSQPELEDQKIFEYINDYFPPGKKCKKCGRLISDDSAEARVFLAPFPYPFNMYKN